MKIPVISTITYLLFTAQAISQNVCDTLPFIDCSKNHILIYNREQTGILSQKFKDLKNTNYKPVKIVHIGDSHLQAGFLTEKIKQELFNQFSIEDSLVSPGFIFPFAIAQTNNPFYYNVTYTGKWEWCKNVNTEKPFRIGLSGITIQTTDTTASFSIKMQNEKYKLSQKYFFNKIKLFHNPEQHTNLGINSQQLELQGNMSEFNLNYLTDSVFFDVQFKDSLSSFELYGIILENDSSKLHYHTIGVNGAEAESYLKCEYFSPELKTIDPDLIIISLGTNEAFDDNFSALEHEFILKDLIFQIKDIVPEASIILITPNDQAKNKKSNKNAFIVRNSILKVCKEFKLNCWDFYSIMGGGNSIQEWYNKGLTGKDKLHFKPKGYEIQGELFVKAFMEMIDYN